MRFLQNLPIRHKLTLAIMLTSCLGLVLAGAFIMTYEWGSYRQRMSGDLSTLARVVSDQSTAALVFDDAKAARETLGALRGKPSLRAAAIYSPSGTLFASYKKGPEESTPAKPGEMGSRFTGGNLELCTPIMQDGASVGTLYMRESLDEMQAQLARYGQIVALALAVLMVLTLGFSTAVQHAISDPVMALAGAARLVSEKKDYSVRVEGKGKDEIGQLIATFNHMLTRIDEADSALRTTNTALHKEVEERQRTEESLRVSEANFQALLDNGIVGVYIVQDGRFICINPRFASMYGYSVEEMVEMGPSAELVYADDREMVEEIFRQRSSGSATAGDVVRVSGVFRGQRKDGRVIYVEGHTSEVEIGGQPAAIGLVLDVTERKQSEMETHRLLTNARCILWRAWVTKAGETEGESGPGSLQWRFMLPDERAAQRVLPLEKPPGCDYMTAWRRNWLEEDAVRSDERTARALEEGASEYVQEFRCRDKDGVLHWMHEEVSVVAVGHGRWDLFGVCTDITASKIAADELGASALRLREVLRRARCILWSGEVEGKQGWEQAPDDPRSFTWHLAIHDEQAAQTVLPLNIADGATYRQALAESRFQMPGSRQTQDSVALAALASGSGHYVQEFACLDADGHMHWLHEEVSIQPMEKGRWKVVGVITDASERKHVEVKLEEYVRRLEGSNRELQDFAYVSSHDLQEPLRAIQNFSERLRTKHGESLNDEGRDYLVRILNSAGRMRVLIQDLLMYSRVTTKAKPFVSTDLTPVAQAVMADLSARLEDTGGRVELGELPVIDCDPTQMRQLLQNLVGNALKFHKPDVPPVVEVYQEPAPVNSLVKSVCIVVRDNGIGFDQKYSDRIFTPFQRLHGQGKYEGTGIGLAICRKIVERHGGGIETRSAPGEGSTFLVTLPVRQEQPQVEV